jgi:murein DD-endopeptidase MepM/ murein hydrolase activator NlpD
MQKTQKIRLAAAAALVAATGLAVPTASQAATARNGVCEAGELCLYYNSNHAGSVSDFSTSISDYGSKQPGCYEFRGAGNGKGLCVKNQAASVWNRTGKSVTVFYNSGYAGSKQTFAAGAKANLNATLKNNNAGHFIGTPPSRTKLSYGLYRAAGGVITCGFDGYRTTSGRHEGIDLKRGLGSSVKSLTSGTVIKVVKGYRGRSGLSTIAVYNSSLNKTIIYLHANPTIKVGAKVAKGTHLGYEDWRGVSYSSSTHTHVEMRLGKQYYAAKSVNDYRLENPNPTTFWRSQGYSIG